MTGDLPGQLVTAAVWAHALAACFMAGLIWFVHVVHYPLFARAAAGDAAAWTVYERAHQARTTLIVGPAMLVETATAALLVLAAPVGVPPWLLWGSLGSLAAVWASTFFVSVPLHARLARGFDARTHRALVATNAPRVLLWSGRAVAALAIAMLHTAAVARTAAAPA